MVLDDFLTLFLQSFLIVFLITFSNFLHCIYSNTCCNSLATNMHYHFHLYILYLQIIFLYTLLFHTYNFPFYGAHVSIFNLSFLNLNIILLSRSVLYIFESTNYLNTSLFGCPYLLFLPTLIIEYLGLISSMNTLPLLVLLP